MNNPFKDHVLDATAYALSVDFAKRLRHVAYSPIVIRPGTTHYASENPVTTKKQKPEKFNTIGVRFLEGPSPQKVYTYKVRIGAKVHLGQELVADTPRGPAVVVVVRIDKKPNMHETYPIGGLKYIEKKAVAL